MGRLVLTRNKGQSILIGDDIVVEIVNVDCGQVKLLVEAPDEVVVLRAELTMSPTDL